MDAKRCNARAQFCTGPRHRDGKSPSLSQVFNYFITSKFFSPNLTHLYALQYEETLNMEVTERLVQTWMASGRDEEANQIVLGML